MLGELELSFKISLFIVFLIFLFYLLQKRKVYIEVVLVYVISVVVNYNVIINLEYFKNILTMSDNVLIDKIVIVLIAMLVAYVYDFVFVFFFQKYNEKRILKKYMDNMGVGDYEYYRGILSDISPGILAYCYNKKIDVTDVVVAIILNLHQKGYIEIKDNQLIILVDIWKLSNHERMAILFNKYFTEKQFSKRFEEALVQDLLKDNYVEKRNKSELDVTGFMELVIIWICIFVFLSYKNLSFSSIDNAVGIVSCCYLIGGLYEVVQNKINSIVMTKKALEIRVKMNGLKNFFEDFSNMNDKKIKDIKFYDEYIMYAIIFDLKGNLNEECEKIYRDVKNLIIKDKSKNK